MISVYALFTLGARECGGKFIRMKHPTDQLC
jgi:hypothetical protein